MNTQQYSTDAGPETDRRLALINRMALFDETARAITHPGPDTSDPAADALLQEFHQAALFPNPESTQLAVWSFDIDLTLQMPEDEPGCRGPIPVSHLARLQRQGAVVGTCSDRPFRTTVSHARPELLARLLHPLKSCSTTWRH